MADPANILPLLLGVAWCVQSCYGFTAEACNTSYYWDSMLHVCLSCVSLCGKEAGKDCKRLCPDFRLAVTVTIQEDVSYSGLATALGIVAILFIIAAVALVCLYIKHRRDKGYTRATQVSDTDDQTNNNDVIPSNA